MSHRIAGVERKGALEFSLSRGKIPVAPDLPEGKRTMRLGEGVIQFDGFLGCRDGALVGFLLRHQRVLAQQVIGVRQADVELSIAGSSPRPG